MNNAIDILNVVKRANRINPLNCIFTGFIVNVLADIMSMFGMPQILYFLIRLIGWYYILSGFNRIQKKGLK